MNERTLIERLNIPWPEHETEEVTLPAWVIELCAEGAARIAALEAQLATEHAAHAETRRERDQLLDKLHCMCGSPIDHSAWEGHTPVSVYDYSLDQERSRAEAAEARVAELEKALEPFADIDGEPWADESGWTDAACQNDRICDWFGPSAFLAARRALTGVKEDG